MLKLTSVSLGLCLILVSCTLRPNPVLQPNSPLANRAVTSPLRLVALPPSEATPTLNHSGIIHLEGPETAGAIIYVKSGTENITVTLPLNFQLGGYVDGFICIYPSELQNWCMSGSWAITGGEYFVLVEASTGRIYPNVELLQKNPGYLSRFQWLIDKLGADKVVDVLWLWQAVHSPTPASMPTPMPASPLATPSTSIAQREIHGSSLVHRDGPLSISRPIDINKAVRGYWETVEGKLGVSPETEIYSHDWYAIDISGDSRAGVTWDDGISCTRTEGRILENEIQLTAHDVEATFVFHDDTHATVAFRRGQIIYVKQVEKTRDDPTPACA